MIFWRAEFARTSMLHHSRNQSGHFFEDHVYNARHFTHPQLCVVRRNLKDQIFPPSAITHRGGALPLEHLNFFVPGKSYRIPMFLATSFNEIKAYEFWYRKFDAGETPVHWVVLMDPAGQHNLMRRCKHVNLVRNSNVSGEEEFLFSP